MYLFFSARKKRSEFAQSVLQYSDGLYRYALKLSKDKDEAEDLVQYGLIPEFVGRLPMIATLEELDVAALMQILTEPKNALTKQYRKMFDMEGVEIDFREDGLRAVATKAMERKTGARGLRSILENVLLESMYNIPSQTGVAKIVVDESVINGDSEPLLVYETQDETIAAQDA